MSFSLTNLFDYLQITRSGFYKRKKCFKEKKEELGNLIYLLEDIREGHPRMGLQVIYDKIKPKQMGRDKFVKTFLNLGYGVRRTKCFRRTTDSSGVKRFDNYLANLELNRLNQCFVSDITYFELNNKFCYLTFIMDLFNREVVGYSVSKSLKTVDTTIPAIKMLIRKRGVKALNGAIFHSDGGGQYYADEFLDITKTKLNLTPSMGKTCFENPHAERLNGVLKNNYIIPYRPKNFKDLINKTKKAVKMYNYEKPHEALGGMTPIAFKLAS